MYIDTHCHLNFPQFDNDRAMVIGNAKKAGVKKFVCPGVDIFSSKQAIALAQKNPGIIYASVGIHPYEAEQNQSLDELEKLIKENRESVVAIGECGLDYHLYKNEEALGKKQKQKILFNAQLELALKYDLPVIMHCRNAFEDFFSVINNLPTVPTGVIHCFSGGLQEVRFARDHKFYIGVDGNLTYSKELQMIHPEIPLSMVLLETDAPFLTPIPHRGERNEPKYIPLFAKKLAELHNVNLDQIQEITTDNAKNLFKF